MPRAPEDLPFTVELWNDDGLHVERVLSKNVNGLIARAAYDKAVDLYPGKNITLRIGIRVVVGTRE